MKKMFLFVIKYNFLIFVHFLLFLSRNYVCYLTVETIYEISFSVLTLMEFSM